MTMHRTTQQSPTVTERDPRWLAVLAHDARADGSFYYSVRSTGIYCRPSCGARRPQARHVAFHATPEDAERAGFRPCRRCKPDQPNAQRQQRAAIVAAACRSIELAATAPTLAQLAAAADLSAYHFHRTFKAVTGLTPKAYADAQRARRVRERLRHAQSVTAAIYDAGYSSSGRFYAQANTVLGMTPSHFRAGGCGTTIRFAVGECSLGSILVAASARGVCAILLSAAAEPLLHELQEQFPHAELVGGDADFEHTVAAVIGWIEAPHLGLSLPLDIRGSAFQQRVWQALCDIPIGATASYSEIAARIGAPNAARAVAGACAANALAVAIPCHRVVRRDGSAGGYRWGIDRKRALLAREQVGKLPVDA